MIERVILLGVFLLAGLLAWLLWRVYQRRRLGQVAAVAAPVEVMQLSDGSRPAVLYFTTADCAQCRLQQTPILGQLAARIDVAVHKLDAVEQETLARFYGIMTVPTTIVLDRRLRPVAINHGVAPLSKLQTQLENLYG